ncbi:MAG: hypothetical protein UW86_C0003G0026 [Microgenomates group bacterium GW2011_GWA1_Microgenomates_45_10]|nr:MAG: hypothetical protein UW73_C0015G0026 [Microgenomates group bacterium GW2011_GWB1_44_8]KKT87381.1 MAG: hypothetical protein UW86_C0003G0026 [Microgenomates group bacterium GW2011_GWA1_Microgenomates_45_10]
MSEMMNRLMLIKQLKAFGMDNKGAQIYLTLLQKGPTTSLEISRLTSYNRTSVYRYLEELKKLGVVEEIIDEHRTLAKASSAEQLKLLVAQKEAEVDQLKHTLPMLAEELSRLENDAGSPTKVLFYRGKNGIQQLLWNSLKIPKGGEMVGLSYRPWNDIVGREFSDKLRVELRIKEINDREVTNTPGPFDYVHDEMFEDFTWRERYLPSSILEIRHETLIYNDVFALFHYHNGELFGVEIHNAEIAKTQKQLFEILWKKAKVIKPPKT